MKESPSIYLSKTDYQVLSLLLVKSMRLQGVALKLKEELARAIVLHDAEVPEDSVGLNSEVYIEDLDFGEVETYVLTLPAMANSDANRISILAPLGVALLGVKAGDEFEWDMPGGVRHLKAIKVCREKQKVDMHGPYRLG